MLIGAGGWVQWECKWLAQQVKWDFSPEEREAMFLAWNIHRESKQRKCATSIPGLLTGNQTAWSAARSW